MVRKMLWGLGALVVLLLLAGSALYLSPPLRNLVLLAPWHSFDLVAEPPAPDYAQDAAWLVLPDHPGNAALVPPGVGAADAEATAAVDVFFIHPTTYYSKGSWNARYDQDGATRDRLENGVVRFQATAFNGCCRIYAPRYRQATLYSFMGKDLSEHQALDFAYQDVLRAFDQFIATRNQGRPFILAGHSQGSLHGMRLLQERIAGTPLAHRMVAAYLVGYAIPRDLKLADGLGPCKSATDTGCYLTWNSLSAPADRTGWQQTSTIWFDKSYQMIAGRPLDCMNPLSWSLDSEAPAADNLGGLAFVQDGAPLKAPRPHLTGAACTDGVLIVTPPTDDPGLTFGVFDGSYHIYDYNLFYMNIRQNLADRVGAYLKAVASSGGSGEIRTP
ncbi:MAG: DUF3089 domain-containing protein [Aliidongia sp.]